MFFFNMYVHIPVRFFVVSFLQCCSLYLFDTQGRSSMEVKAPFIRLKMKSLHVFIIDAFSYTKSPAAPVIYIIPVNAPMKASII